MCTAAPKLLPATKHASAQPKAAPHRSLRSPVRQLAGGVAYKNFQDQMRFLLNKVRDGGEPAADNYDIGAQVWRVLKENPDISEDRMLSEIGMLFVEGFETTGEPSGKGDYAGGGCSIFLAWLAAARHARAATACWHAHRGSCMSTLTFCQANHCWSPTPGSCALPAGHTTSWTLFNIATHPEAQAKIAAELDALGLLHKPGHTPRELELDDLKRMPYLSAALKEAMRMFPVVSLMARATDRVMRVGGFTVPSGTIVATPLFAIHNTVHNWDEPHSFRPERWLDVPVEAYVYNSKAAEAGGKRGITFMPFRCVPRGARGGEHAACRLQQRRTPQPAASLMPCLRNIAAAPPCANRSAQRGPPQLRRPVPGQDGGHDAAGQAAGQLPDRAGAGDGRPRRHPCAREHAPDAADGGHQGHQVGVTTRFGEKQLACQHAVLESGQATQLAFACMPKACPTTTLSAFAAPQVPPASTQRAGWAGCLSGLHVRVRRLTGRGHCPVLL